MKGTEFIPEIAWSLLNTPDTGDVVVANSSNGNTVAITGLPTFDHADYVSYTSEVSVLEVAQIQRIAMANAVTAATRYGFEFGSTDTQEFGYMGVLKGVKHSSPAVLTGTTATDKHNLYVALAIKANLDKRRFLRAYPVITIAHAAESGGTFAAGDTITGATSGATGVLVSDGSNIATIRLTSLNPYKIFQNGENLTNGTATGAASAGPTLGVGLDLVDYGSYYDAAEKKKGATIINLTDGFVTGDITVTTAAVYSRGLGSWLAGRVPVPERTSGNLASGAWNMALNNPPVVGGYYTKYSLKIRRRTPGEASQGNQARTTEYTLVVWAKETSQGTAPSNFNTAIAAL